MSLKIQLLVMAGLIVSTAQAEQDAYDEQAQKCEEALEKADSRLQDLVSRNMVISPASINNQQGQAQSPIAEMMNKMAENQQKQAELAQQRIQKLGEIDDEQFRQGMEINDKVHDFRKEDYKRRQEIISLEFAKRKSDAEIRNKCRDEADNLYSQLLQRSREQASTTNLSTESTQYLSGTRARMQAKRKEYENICLARPQTQEAFSLNLQEMNAKMRNLKLENERIQADINYVESKVPLMNSHFDEKRGRVEMAASMQANALAQANMMQQVALGMAMATSAADAATGNQVAGTTTSAAQTLQNFQTIESVCKATGQAIAVPADVYPIFSSVNRECRPDRSPSSFCVQSSGQQSMEMRGSNTTN